MDDHTLQARLSELAPERRRFGYRRLHVMLRREGIEVNHKRVYRLYRETGLAVRQRKRRKAIAVERQPLLLPDVANPVWSMDFVMDATANGRRIKILTIVDDFTKESIDLVVARSISGNDVVRDWMASLNFEVVQQRYEQITGLNTQARHWANGLINTR